MTKMATRKLTRWACVLVLAARAAHGSWGVDVEYLSESITPGTNFYRYVNEGWLSSVDMPAGYSFYSEPWAAQDAVLAEVREAIRAAATSPSTATARRVGDLYNSFVDAEQFEKSSLPSIKEELRQILALESHSDVVAWMANPRSNSIFHLLAQPPVNMKGGYVLTVAQYRVTGLGLPGQVYYKSEESSYSDIRTRYVQYIANSLRRAGLDRVEQRAGDILDLEKRYADVMWDFARLRDAGAAFKLVDRTKLEDYAPGFPWQVYLDARGVGNVSEVNIGVGALQESAALFSEIPVSTWVSYLAFHWINNHADLLPGEFGEAAFQFYDAGLWGTKERRSRSERAVEFVQRHLGDDVGTLYVEKHFPTSNREDIEEIVRYVRLAFAERLTSADWMDHVTKSEAMAKLDAIIVEVGEPRAGTDWSRLVTRPDDLVGNYARILEYGWASQANRVGRPVSRFGDWNMHPHRIGAGYHQQYNKIFVTAGALLPPFFDPNADPAVNFGAIGTTIAHEFGHALDDQGSRFDRSGALRNWWTEESRIDYNGRTEALVAQFAAYSPLPGVYLAADQMIGEIVADLAGASIAYRAYQMYVADHYADGAPTIDGYSGGQRFFMSIAQQSRTIATENALRDEALHASHPPAEFRINGVVRNMDEWYSEFDVGPNDELYLEPESRIRLW